MKLLFLAFPKFCGILSISVSLLLVVQNPVSSLLINNQSRVCIITQMGFSFIFSVRKMEASNWSLFLVRLVGRKQTS